jgi:4-hydroxybenzoate polyprenyltransferase
VRLRDLFELVRLPNVFTAPADVAMGLAAAAAAPTARHALLFGASALAYAGGMALNDACDAALDGVERPRRPIPSGRVSRGAAFAVAAILLAGALALCALVSRRSLAFGAVLVTAIVLYDVVARRTAVGPLAMASCRALDAGLGLSVAAWRSWSLAPVVLLFGWVFAITEVSRFEVGGDSSRAVRGGAVNFALLILVAAIWLVQRGGLAGLPLLGLLACWMAPPLRRALVEPAPRHIIAVIKASVLGIILFDAAFVGGTYGIVAAVVVAALFAPAYVLGRRFASA